MTEEKGKDNIIKFCKKMEDNKLPYLFTVFTDDVNTINNPNIIYMQPRLDITDYIADADYLFQGSKDESFCYSVVEALSVGTPVIVSDLPVFKELGIKDGVNGWVFNTGMSNLDIEKIYNTKLKFKYEPPQDTWGEELAKGKKTYKKSGEYNTLQATENFTYTRFKELKNMIRYNETGNKDGTVCDGDIFDCDDDIMNFLLNITPNKANRSLVRVLLYKDE